MTATSIQLSKKETDIHRLIAMSIDVLWTQLKGGFFVDATN